MENKYFLWKTMQSLDKNREIMRNNKHQYKQKQSILFDFKNYR